MNEEGPNYPRSFAFFRRMTEPDRISMLYQYTDRLDFYLKDNAFQSAEWLEFDLQMFEPGRIYHILRDILTYCIAARRNYFIDRINTYTNLSPNGKRSAVASGLRIRKK